MIKQILEAKEEILVQDNSIGLISQETILRLYLILLQHLTYSLDLASCDLNVSPTLWNTVVDNSLIQMKR